MTQEDIRKNMWKLVHAEQREDRDTAVATVKSVRAAVDNHFRVAGPKSLTANISLLIDYLERVEEKMGMARSGR